MCCSCLEAHRVHEAENMHKDIKSKRKKEEVTFFTSPELKQTGLKLFVN